MVLNRSLLPLVLAQLLIQFQKPIIIERTQNNTNLLINETMPPRSSNYNFSNHRNVRAILPNQVNEELDNQFGQFNLLAPDYSSGILHMQEFQLQIFYNQ